MLGQPAVHVRCHDRSTAVAAKLRLGDIGPRTLQLEEVVTAGAFAVVLEFMYCGFTEICNEALLPQVANPDYREYTYLLLGGGDFIYASAVRLGVIQVRSAPAMIARPGRSLRRLAF